MEDFVIELAGLSCLSIYLMSARSPRSYASLKAMISIMRCFSLVVLSLMRHSYSERESIQAIIGIDRSLRRSIILLIVPLSAIIISTLYTIV